VLRKKKEKGCLPVVYLLDILVVFSVSHPDMNMIVYRTGQDRTVYEASSARCFCLVRQQQQYHACALPPCNRIPIVIDVTHGYQQTKHACTVILIKVLLGWMILMERPPDLRINQNI